MIGVIRKNPDRNMFIKDGQLILKALNNGNIDQSGSEANDWILGDIGDDKIAIMGKFQGGNTKVPANYDLDSHIDADNYPDI